MLFIFPDFPCDACVSIVPVWFYFKILFTTSMTQYCWFFLTYRHIVTHRFHIATIINNS